MYQWVVDNRVIQIALVALAVTYLVKKCCAYKPTLVEMMGSDPERFNKYVEKTLVKDFYRCAVSQSRALGIETDEQYVIQPLRAHYIKPIKFDGDNVHPVEGEWSCSFELTLLGTPRQYNVFFRAQADGPPKFYEMNIGTSNADPYLQGDVNKRFTELHNDIKCIECKVETIKEGVGVWSEKWTIYRQNQTDNYVIIFSPDGYGGTNFDVRSLPNDQVA